MKKLLCIAMSLVLLLTLVACASKNRTPELSSGYYYASGKDTKYLGVVTIDTNEQKFQILESHLYSYSEYGTYKIKSGKLIVATENVKFTFEIKDEHTLVLTQFTDKVWDWLQVGMEFVYSENMK